MDSIQSRVGQREECQARFIDQQRLSILLQPVHSDPDDIRQEGEEGGAQGKGTHRTSVSIGQGGGGRGVAFRG